MVTSAIHSNQKGNLSIYGSLLCISIIVLASITIQTHDNPPLNNYTSKNIAATKPYATFDEFYPFYLNEHTQKITRQCHYVGTTLFLLYLVTQPILLLPLLTGGLAAYSIIPFSRHLSTGLAEVILFLIVYFTSGKLLTRSFLKTLIPLLFGYGCSWIGHFGFEHNKPAAFIYPTYSFFGDIHMMYDAIKEQRFF